MSMMGRLCKLLAIAFWIAFTAVLALPAIAQDPAAFELDETQPPRRRDKASTGRRPALRLRVSSTSARRGEFETSASYLNLDGLSRDLVERPWPRACSTAARNHQAQDLGRLEGCA